MTNAYSFCSCLALCFCKCGTLLASPKNTKFMQHYLSFIIDKLPLGLIYQSERREKKILHLSVSIQSEAKYVYQSVLPAGLEPSGEMESWFRSLDNLPRSVGVFQQANSTPSPGMGSPRGSAGSDDWAIGAGQAGSSGSSPQPRGSSASKQGMKAAKGVGR